MSRFGRLKSAFEALTGALEKAAKTNLIPKRVKKSSDFLEKEAPVDTIDFREIPAENSPRPTDNPVQDGGLEPPVKIVIPASALGEEAEAGHQEAVPVNRAMAENANTDSSVADELLDGLLVKMNGGRPDGSEPAPSSIPDPSGSAAEGAQSAPPPLAQQQNPVQPKPATQKKEYLNKWLNKLAHDKTQEEPESAAVDIVPVLSPTDKEEAEATQSVEEQVAEPEETVGVQGEASPAVGETEVIEDAEVVAPEEQSMTAGESTTVSEEKAKVLEEKAKVLEEKAKVLDEKAKILEAKNKTPVEKASVPEEKSKVPGSDLQKETAAAGGEKNLFASLFGNSEVVEESPIDRLIKSLPDITIAEVMNQAEEVKGLMDDWFQAQDR